MNASRASFAAAAAVLSVLTAAPVVAQSANFDDRPTGFLTATTGGMPANAWAGTSLATAKRLVAALPNAPRSRALRDLQFKVLVSQLTPPTPDGSPPPSLFMLKVEKLAAMGEAESLNEMVRNAGGYADPAIASTVANALMLAGERQGACAVVGQSQLTEAVFQPRQCRLQGVARRHRRGPCRYQRAGRPDRRSGADGHRPHARPGARRRAAQYAAVHRSGPGRPQGAADRHPHRDRRARRGAGHHRGDEAWRSLSRGVARWRRAAAGGRAPRPHGRGGAQCVEPNGDGQFDRCRLRRGARQPAVSHHRAGERRRPDQSAGPAAVRQRRSGGDAGLPAAGRQAAGAGLGSPGAEARSRTTRGPSSRSTGWCRWRRSRASTMPSS